MLEIRKEADGTYYVPFLIKTLSGGEGLYCSTKERMIEVVKREYGLTNSTLHIKITEVIEELLIKEEKK